MVSGILGALAGFSWIAAAISWGLAVRHRAEGQSFASHLFAGYKAFDPNNFDEVGKRHQRRMMYAMGGFVLFAMSAGVAGALRDAMP